MNTALGCSRRDHHRMAYTPKTSEARSKIILHQGHRLPAAFSSARFCTESAFVSAGQHKMSSQEPGQGRLREARTHEAILWRLLGFARSDLLLTQHLVRVIVVVVNPEGATC